MPASAADQRLLDLIDRWLASLELHLQYAKLDDAAYRRVQNWVEHERPSKWIIELARQKTLALKAQVLRRMETGDAEFSEALEMTIFLANLVGLQHIERFIPLADAAGGATVRAPSAGTAPAPAAAAPGAVADSSGEATREMPAARQSTGNTATREMPHFEPRTAKPAPDAARVARGERGAEARPQSAATGKPAAKPAKPAGASARSVPPIPAAAREQVIADAVRLLQWGRKWYELAEAISRLADRPSVTDVRRILKDNKAVIDQQMPAR